jgi:hypothetical protein
MGRTWKKQNGTLERLGKGLYEFTFTDDEDTNVSYPEDEIEEEIDEDEKREKGPFYYEEDDINIDPSW